jgi:phage shock protein C
MGDNTNITPPKTTRLYRSEKNRILGGVAGGLGEYFDIDPTIVRIIFVMLTIFGGYGVLFYLILWVVMPAESNVTPYNSQEIIQQNLNEVKNSAQKWSQEARDFQRSPQSHIWLGVVILLFGVMFLFHNLGLFMFWNISRLWPVLLVVFGLSLLVRK